MQFRRIGCVTAAWLFFYCTAAGFSADKTAAHPRISGLERLHVESSKPVSDEDYEDEPRPERTIPRDPALEGRVLLGELNCLSCHSPSEELKPFVSPKQAPNLDDVGSRVKVDWLRDYLLDVHAAKAGATMPDVFHGLTTAQRMDAVEALVHFLAQTGKTNDVIRDSAAAQRGKVLYHQVGCVACHDPQEGDAAPIATSVPLPNLSQKYSSTSLAAFLKETHKARPSGRMPVFPLNDQQFRDLAHYLVKDVSIEPNVQFAAFHGGWGALPNFGEMKPVAEGECGGFDLGVAGRPNDFGVRFRGQLHLVKAGKYAFHLGSDDGSRLLIDGKRIVDNDGVHPHAQKSAQANLEAGWHEVVVDYFQGGGEWTLNVDIEGNGLARQPLGSLLTRDREPAAAAEKAAFTVQPELAEKGRQLFTSLNCAECHMMHQDGQRLSPRKTAKPLAELRLTAGCLSKTPLADVPNFRLSPMQRQQLTAALSTPPVETASQTVHRLLLTFNCYACHERGGWGGVEESRNAYFQSLIKEMGDESRLPPTLTGVGDKLRDDWMKHLLEHSSNDRQNYMLVKMPKFGLGNVGILVELFAKADRPPESAEKPEFHEPDYRVKAAGRQLVGGTALGCIKCHDFREYPSTGIRAISLTTMPRRLREDWFLRYMLNPQEYRPGTRMPAPWPNGRASITDVLDANTPLQMRAVWRYLADGNKAAIPAGLIRQPIELKPTDAPILYRNFIEGSGNRAIAVGYPEHVNLAFDANDFRLALIWHGAFVDASRHWNDRGAGTVGPLGDDLIELGSHPSFAKLTSANDSWPTQSGREAGFHFLGYTLDQRQRPTFRYRFGDVAIEDHPEPFSKSGDKYPGIKRTLTLALRGSENADLWYRRHRRFYRRHGRRQLPHRQRLDRAAASGRKTDDPRLERPQGTSRSGEVHERQSGDCAGVFVVNSATLRSSVRRL